MVGGIVGGRWYGDGVDGVVEEATESALHAWCFFRGNGSVASN